MNNRFFEKSKNIEDITDKEINDFLSNERLIGSVQKDRVRDFYNALSNVSIGKTIENTKKINYDHWHCKNREDEIKIDKLKNMEREFLNSVNKDVLNSSRLLKASAALAYQFEKMMTGETDIPEDINTYLRNLFEYHEYVPGDPATFGEIIKMDFNFLRYIALLSKKKAFMKKNGRLERSFDGNIHKYTPMETFDEIFHMDMSSIVLPNFKNKLAQKDLYVRSRFEKVERGQNIAIIVDDSGSMNKSEKKGMLRAALTLKLQDISDAHNIYLATFERDLSGFIKLEKGMKFEDVNKFIHLNGGGTDVNGCVKETIRQIKEGRLRGIGSSHYDLNNSPFEVLVINDGQDDVDPTYHPPIKTHALCLMQTNHNLKNICHRSGGTYFHVYDE